MKKRKNKLVLTRAVWIFLSLAISNTAQAEPWKFNQPVVIAPIQKGVFHHIDSSGRHNISAGNKNVTMVWEDNRSGKPAIYFVEAKIGGAFTQPVKINGAGEAYEPIVQRFSEGWVIGWEEDRQVWACYHSQKQFCNPTRLSELSASQISLTAGNSGEIVAVWSEASEKHSRVMYAGLELSKGDIRVTKKAPLDIKPGAGDQNHPSVAYHEAMGTYVVIWEDRRYQNVMLFSAMGTVKNGFSVGMQVNELRAPISGLYGVASGVARGALTAYDKHVAAVWSDKRNFRFGYEIFSAFARHSGRFGENSKVQDGFGDGFEQWHPTIAAHGASLAVAWDDDRDGNSDIWLSYRTVDGWSDDVAVPGASGEGFQTHPSLAMDHSGGLHLMWLHRDAEGGNTSIRYLYGPAAR